MNLPTQFDKDIQHLSAMSLFDKFLPDKRKRFASQIANLYRTVKDANPNASEKRIDELSIGELYSVSTMKRKAMLLYHLDKVSDIYELAHGGFRLLANKS